MKKTFETLVLLAGMYGLFYILMGVVQLGEFAAQVLTEVLTF